MALPMLTDTSVLAEMMKPGSPAAAWAAARTVEEPCYVSSISVFEVIFGFQQAVLRALRQQAPEDAAAWSWRGEQFAQFIRRDCFVICPWDGDAALVAAHLYARLPSPPQAGWHRTRSRGKTKTEVRRSWLLDVMIASIAITHGLPLLTRNIIDFGALSDVLPEQWRLDVRAFPEQAPS